MTIPEARKIREDFYRLTDPDDEDRFMMAEALEFLIIQTKDPGYMLDLGGLYYGQEQFELASKYYEMAAEDDNTYAFLCLGYIWYYGRTGKPDYEKAFHYFELARMRGNHNAAYKVADMYLKGLYVDKDPAKYREIIDALYDEMHLVETLYTGDPYSKLPEVYLRMGTILAEEGKTEEALKLFDTTRDVLSRRIRDSAFFGDRTIMRELIGKIYRLRMICFDDLGLYDLYALLETPCRVRFKFEEESHEAEAVEEDGAVVIRFDDTWYRSVSDFFAGARIGRMHLTTLYEELYDFVAMAGRV